MEQLGGFARYSNRLDCERGADPDGPRDANTMFGYLGIEMPRQRVGLES